MHRNGWFLSLAGIGVVATALCHENPSAKPLAQPKVEAETIRGQWRLPDDMLIRMVGKVAVVNARTLRFEDGTMADLGGGIDTPELEQQGRIGGEMVPCGREAVQFLEKLIDGRPVTCYLHPKMVEGRKYRSGSAFVGETNLQIEMVRNGWAIANHSQMAAWEAIARANRRGLWRGDFVLPEEWRKRKRLPGER